MKNLKLLFVLTIVLAVTACGGKDFTKSPVDELVKQMDGDSTFSIILYDMNVEGTFFKDYYHKYKVVRMKDGKPSSSTTDWQRVTKEFFALNENNMGMEIASKVNGKVSKEAAPPGYSNYVGNSRYGYWNNSGGSSFWVFYGQYSLMRDMLGWGSYRVGRDSWTTYDRSYRGSRPYYGPKTTTGGNTFGTRSTFAKKTNPSSTWANKLESRKSRNASRYNSGYSSRSRSGGFGK
ncbi:MAG: hypothetical protein SCALA702_37010 [Melioribacteraceae bacterium]|nr:MAG: hypothetical protein SCALA702_37010 [Melioribacteraceae bacterium]